MADAKIKQLREQTEKQKDEHRDLSKAYENMNGKLQQQLKEIECLKAEMKEEIGQKDIQISLLTKEVKKLKDKETIMQGMQSASNF